MARKTIIKKLESVEKNTKTKKTVGKKKVAKVKKQSPDNISYDNFLEMQEKELQKIENDSMSIKKQLADEYYQKKAQVAQVKYRTKYMQLEHERQGWNKKEANYLDIISKLRGLAMKYAPLEEVFEVSGEITEISQKTKAGKTPLEMPKK